jgi:dihydrofolate reductase
MQVSLIAAVSADGFIARSASEPSFDWTRPEDTHFYVQTIKSVDAIIMGHKSFQTFSKYPKDSRWVIYTSQPENFINPKPQVINATATKDEPKLVLENLAKENCSKVAICGGSSIYNLFINSGLVDKIYLTVEPVFFGSGIKLFSDTVNINVTLNKVHDLSSQTKVMEYDVIKA